MSSLDELYKEVILDHYRSPRNRGKLEPSDFDLHRDNPLCGDEIHVYAQVEDGKITGIAFEGKGSSRCPRSCGGALTWPRCRRRTSSSLFLRRRIVSASCRQSFSARPQSRRS